MAYRQFSQAIIEKLQYYVYVLIDPRTDNIFYVGKGTNNRLFGHLTEAIGRVDSTDKLDQIRQIHDAGLEIKYWVLRHGLTEKEAFEVEASLIDIVNFLSESSLTNLVAGHHSNVRGAMTVDELFMQYDAPQLDISEPVILILVNRFYRSDMTKEELYNVTRGDWVIGPRRNDADYALCVFRGIVRQVYRIDYWEECNQTEQSKRTRWRFTGSIADELQHYCGGSVAQYIGTQNPIRYLNC